MRSKVLGPKGAVNPAVGADIDNTLFSMYSFSKEESVHCKEVT